jgi:cation transport protein ChaC
MWVFGYGSLMWDGWETSRGCTRRSLGDLPGYCRAFNKASVKNWGNSGAPGPTLNLRKIDVGVCRGMAFEFGDDRRDQLLKYLTEREGGPATDLTIHLDDGNNVIASVPLYVGKNIIVGKTAKEIISMVRSARGTSGSCVAYVKGIFDKLHELGIEDTEVQATWQAVRDHT